MKNKLFLVIFSMSSMSFIAQTKTNNEHFKDSINKWTIEAYAGQSKGMKPYSPGYFSSNPNKYGGDLNINHYNAAVRYMISPKFGFKLDLGFDNIANNKGTTSLPFKVYNYTMGIEGVINFSRLLNLEEYFGRFGILVHAGGIYSRTTPQMNTTVSTFKNETEDNGGVVFGVTPQFRLSDRLSVLADFTVVNNIRQHYTWDGALSTEASNLSGQLASISFGISYSLGRQKMHGDWAKIPNDKSKQIALENRILELESITNDTDKDGIPDYLDLEKNTKAGLTVDSKGRSIDNNNNQVPDGIEKYIESKYSSVNEDVNAIKSENSDILNNSQMKSMINNGYVSVFFDFNKSAITSGNISSINFLIKYLKSNPSAKTDIIGYADAIGDIKINNKLAESRAKNVKETIVKYGIDSKRLNIIVKGVDNSVPKNSRLARQLVTRVAFEVK